jgi:hypothetical protein
LLYICAVRFFNYCRETLGIEPKQADFSTEFMAIVKTKQADDAAQMLMDGVGNFAKHADELGLPNFQERNKAILVQKESCLLLGCVSIEFYLLFQSVSRML